MTTARRFENKNIVITGAASGIGQATAIRFAEEGGNIAILDVNVDGEQIFPVADILAKRGLPFVFVTGYGEGSLPDTYRSRPALQKPFQADRLKAMLEGLLPVA